MTQKKRSSNQQTQQRQSKPAATGRAYTSHANYSQFRSHSQYMRGAPINMANNAGVLKVPGRVRDANNYRERLRDNQKYPNRRRKIITGKDLTTPLGRKKAIETARREHAKQAIEDKIRIKHKTIAVVKKKFPVNAVFCVIITTFFLLCLIYSQIVLNEKNVQMNNLNDGINAEIKREKVLMSEFDSKNDLNFIINYAVKNLGMINEDLLQKYYITDRQEDRVMILEDKGGAAAGLPNIMSAILKMIKSD